MVWHSCDEFPPLWAPHVTFSSKVSAAETARTWSTTWICVSGLNYTWPLLTNALLKRIHFHWFSGILSQTPVWPGSWNSCAADRSSIKVTLVRKADLIAHLWYACELNHTSSLLLRTPGSERYSRAIGCRRKASLSPFSCLYPLSHQDDPSIITRKLPLA